MSMASPNNCGMRNEPRSADFTHISGSLGDLLKEILRSVELRPRLEAEKARLLSDQEFIVLAEQTGMRI
jgi:hypothetical protein